MVQKLKRRMPRTKSSVKGNRAIEIRKKELIQKQNHDKKEEKYCDKDPRTNSNTLSLQW